MYLRPCTQVGPPLVEAQGASGCRCEVKTGCEVRLCCQQQRSKSLLQGDGVVKVTRSFPEFPSSNYSTTGRVEVGVETTAFCCEDRVDFRTMLPPSILLRLARVFRVLFWRVLCHDIGENSYFVRVWTCRLYFCKRLLLVEVNFWVSWR